MQAGSGHASSSITTASSTSVVPAPGVAAPPRLVKAAHEFEAALMKELMAPLDSEQGSLGDDSGAGGYSSALTSFAGEALGKAISDDGGFGIANRIITQVGARAHVQGNHSGTPPVTGISNHRIVLSTVK